MKYKIGDCGWITKANGDRMLFKILEVLDSTYIIYNFAIKVRYKTIRFEDFDEVTAKITNEEKLELL
jgi:hypothetical protein